MNFEDKRRFVRINSLNLSYVLVDGQDQADKQTMGRTLDVSEAGIRLETHFPVSLGSEMSLSIGLENNLVDIKGRVVHTSVNDEGRYETGVEFIDKSADVKDILMKFIKAFKAERGLKE